MMCEVLSLEYLVLSSRDFSSKALFEERGFEDRFNIKDTIEPRVIASLGVGGVMECSFY